jgi:radical SAM superfamily enzyme YgiQ (UPF0313 family)
LSSTLFLVTPPFTQLNTPYPATAYLKGFLNTKNISTYQSDLGIEVILKLLSKDGLKDLFNIESIISFLQGHNPTLAQRICQGDFIPRASRFDQIDDLQWAFGQMGVHDKAKHLATLYLEDIADFIKECIDEHFGFSRYAERLGRSANSFDELHSFLSDKPSYIDEILIEILAAKIKFISPKLVAFSVPFPGNLYSAFRCAQWIKKNHPEIKTVMGGGFPNTELRSVSDTRVFEYMDFITLDDGETPIGNLIEHIEGKRDVSMLKRTFTLHAGKVVYYNNSLQRDYKQHEVGTPDYADLFLDKYISVIEIVNPMHRLWNDGRWNKLTMAHGCYWGKCTFCDISLDYIKSYEPLTASILCDRMQEMIISNGENGFHFVDEAAPPALMKSLALEIIKRKMIVSWWTNIRFEKSFSRDLCVLLKASGCIGVSGGLEVASDRLLKLIEKGVSVAQVAQVMQNLSQAGIMVHAYLMYGFPTQTAQETIDSLEMVRQMFKTGILKSGFWHQFAMTAHSPVGMNPEKYFVKKEKAQIGTFANNDLVHIDPSGTDHEAFSFGLKKSLFNYMHSIGLEEPLQKWFDHKTPKPSVDNNYIAQVLETTGIQNHSPNAKVIWLGALPLISFFTKSKKSQQWEMASITFTNKNETNTIQVSKQEGLWLMQFIHKIGFDKESKFTFQDMMNDYEDFGLLDFDLFWYNKPMNGIWKIGFLIV